MIQHVDRQQLEVAPGEQIQAGSELAVLADHCVLHIEAQAFEDDAALIREAAREDRKVTAVLVTAGSQSSEISDLDLVRYVVEIEIGES